MTSQIRSRIKRVENRYILYDTARVNAPTPDLFDPEVLKARGRVSGSAQGRGEAWFLQWDDHDWVLRHFRRGGMIGRLVADMYFGRSPESSRAFREWRLLADLYHGGLPVPRPIAACVEQHLFFYRADIIIERIPGVRSLAQVLKDQKLPAGQWQKIGKCIRRFHDIGCWHADLNAHNILINSDGEVFVIDFDRGRLRQPGRWAGKNLERLQRSLKKIARTSGPIHFQHSDWHTLLEGYRQAET